MAQLNTDAMSREEKQWTANAIAGMVCSDGHVDESEMIYLKEAISFLEDREEINKLLSMVKKKQLQELSGIQMDPNQGFAILKHLAGISIVDGRMSPSEIRYFKRVGKLLGMPEGLLEKIMLKTRKHMESNLPNVTATINEQEYQVPILYLSEEGCTFRFERMLLPNTRITFDFTPQGQGGEEGGEKEHCCPMLATATGARPSKLGETSFTVKTEFQQKITEAHGILQILYPDRQTTTTKKKLESSNSSLLGRYVQCYVCGHQVAFWSLRIKSMVTELNTLGMTIYVKPIPGKDHCDYNLLQVAVCPDCFFASNDINYFRSEINAKCPFDEEAFKKSWMDSAPVRKQKLQGQSEFFSADTRTADQAILTYVYAIETHQRLEKLKSDNKNPRKMVSLLLPQAELLMNKGKTKAAENNLKRVEHLLEPIFENLSDDAVFKAATTLSLIKLYFKDYEGVNKYMTFLINADREGTVSPTSPEGRALKAGVNLVKKSYDQREAYGYDKLKTFHLPQSG